MNPTFQSVFAAHLAKYIAVRRGLGLRFDNQEGVLRTFDNYVCEGQYQGPLSQEIALAFAMRGKSIESAVRRYLIVRHFSEYLAIYDPGTPRLDPKAIFRRKQQPPPYIFTDEEIERLLHQTNLIPQRPVVANRALRTMIGLAATTGLRLREVIALDQDDVDLDSGVLHVRRSKFDKDRLVPVHSSTRDALRAYAAARTWMSRAGEETAFFLNARSRRFQSSSVDRSFRKLIRAIDLRSPHRKLPTFGSLRHTFAVRRLITWYRAGANVQALLPALATFMGHVHYTSTSYYLTATAELLGVAADRLSTEAPHGQEA